MFFRVTLSAIAATFSLAFGQAAFADGVTNTCIEQAKYLVETGYNEGGVYLEDLSVVDSTPYSVLLLADWIYALDEAVPYSRSTYVRFSCADWPARGIKDQDGDGAETLNDAESLETPRDDVGLSGNFRFTASSVGCASGVFFDGPVISPCLAPAEKILVVGKGNTKKGQSTLVSLAKKGARGVILGKLSPDGTTFIVRVISH